MTINCTSSDFISSGSVVHEPTTATCAVEFVIVDSFPITTINDKIKTFIYIIATDFISVSMILYDAVTALLKPFKPNKIDIDYNANFFVREIN